MNKLFDLFAGAALGASRQHDDDIFLANAADTIDLERRLDQLSAATRAPAWQLQLMGWQSH